jgi:hypothetical protein
VLSPADDLPIHQIAEPIRQVGTSDRNFYDRYYFNMHPSSGDLFTIFGLGVYPNLGVMDAFLCARQGDTYQVVRASKEIGADRTNMAIGPFRIEVLEGLKRVRFVVEPNEWGLDMDVTWDAAIPAHLEPPHHRRQFGRITFDTSRFAQTGRWTGTLTFHGATHDVTPDHWWGCRDRSWGVRPIGEAEPAGIRAGHPAGGFYWNYAPMQFDDFSILYIAEEQPDGTRTLEEAVRIPADGSPAVSLGRPEHELEFISGTREVKRARIHMTEPDGTPVVIDVEPLLPVFLAVGTGYGTENDWRHGMYQGPLKVESLTWDFNNPADKAKMVGFVDAVARFRVGDHVGYGLWEYVIAGAHEKYGFTGYTDVAP